MYADETTKTFDLFASPLISRYYDFEIHGKNGSAAQAYAEKNSISFVNTGSEYQLGDVDLDGRLSVKDATLILKQNVCLVTITAEQMELADFDRDGRVSVTDATAIQIALIKS